MEGGRCTGVVTDDGERYLARHAVVSTIHVKHLVEMAPSELWGDDFLYGIETYDGGISSFAQYYATTEPPRFVAPSGGAGGGTQTAVSAGVVAWPEDVLQAGRDVREGKLLHARWMLAATPTLVDPARAPERQHTVKLLTMCPWNDGDWGAISPPRPPCRYPRRAAPRRAEHDSRHDPRRVRQEPGLDIERHNEHMWHGAIHGWRSQLCERLLDAALSRAGAQHRMPIPGLDQTGATTIRRLDHGSARPASARSCCSATSATTHRR